MAQDPAALWDDEEGSVHYVEVSVRICVQRPSLGNDDNLKRVTSLLTDPRGLKKHIVFNTLKTCGIVLQTTSEHTMSLQAASGNPWGLRWRRSLATLPLPPLWGRALTAL